MAAQTLEDILITDKEISGYMSKRDNTEHLKIKRPSEYVDAVESYFSDDLTGGISYRLRKLITILKSGWVR